MPTTNFYYTQGGTMPLNVLSYIERPADDELYQALKQGEYCHILTSSQMGKSSLVLRVTEGLRKDGLKVVNFSLATFGTTAASAITIDNWYRTLLTEIDKQLELQPSALGFWESLQPQNLTPTYCWGKVIRQIILGQTAQPIVICLDEIGAVQTLPAFTDDFLVSLREFHNARTTEPDLSRLTFCLIGTATPADLMKDRCLPPFNVGRRIQLEDFTEAQAGRFAEGLHRDATQAMTLVQRIWYWTNGHPYLTQKFCDAVANEAAVTTPKGVDRVCEELFLSSHARRTKEGNVDQVAKAVISYPDRAALLELYRQIRRRKRIKDDETDVVINALRLTGLVRVLENYLWVRNHIYYRVFDDDWIVLNLPDAEKRRQKAAQWRGFLQATGMATVVIVIIAFLAVSARLAEQRAVKNEQIAEQQRNIAEKQKSLALQAVNTLTYDLIDQLLAIPRTKQIVLSIFETNVQTLEAIAKLNPDTPQAQREKAVNQRKIGNVWMVLGDTQKALAAYQQGLEVAKRLAAADPTNTEAQRDVSVSYSKLAEVHLTQNELPEALAGYQQALAIAEKLLTQDPRNQTLQEDLAWDQSKIDEIKGRLKK